jgi:hypothetical protein
MGMLTYHEQSAVSYLGQLNIQESRELVGFLNVSSGKVKEAARRAAYPYCIPLWELWGELRQLVQDALQQFYLAKGPNEIDIARIRNQGE